MIDLDTASRTLHIPKSTLRYWESEGLLTSKRGENNYRQYDERYLIEIGDIDLYRKLGVGIKKINAVRTYTPEELDAFYTASEHDIDAKIAALKKTKEQIKRKRALIAQTESLKGKPALIETNEAGVSDRQVVAFDVTDEHDVGRWLDNPYDPHYGLAFENGWSCSPRDAWLLSAGEVPDAERLHCYQAETALVQTLLVCDAGDISISNLSDIRKWCSEQGLSTGFLFAQYLTNAFDTERGRECSYYRMLAEIDPSGA